MLPQLTLYTAKCCPFAQRVEMAFSETGIKFSRCEIDLLKKPDWYSRVNTALEVPALSYGGSSVDPSRPSPDSIILTESLVLVELVNDLSNNQLLPSTLTPVQRGKARYFMTQISNKLVPAYVGTMFKGESADRILTAVDAIQCLLPAEGYLLGEQFTMADIVAAPFLARTKVVLSIIGQNVSAAQATLNTLETDDKFSRFRKYFDDITGRESFKTTYFEDIVKADISERLKILATQAEAGRLN
ncbi:hypothetical protein BDZ94DRAFT_1276164 [Collybia nuda]|uniref:GST N-terminal domain-containing protein n=1 Tax=Collybia nuda TaxID=64659 RepID=A0A9P5XVH0_9AGAR|nr:hypothetical protein BDZ94DRAFT_1276164 [Collybia nuda]